MAYKTIKRVSVPNLKSFGPTKTELQAKEIGELSIMLYAKMSWERSLAHQHGCRNIHPFSIKCREPSHGSYTDAMAYHVIASD